MRCLSIRQPWVWFTFCGFPWAKDVENRQWNDAYLEAQLKLCPVGSEFFIHAASGCTKQEYEDAVAFARKAGATQWPKFDDMQRGGIVGTARLGKPVLRSKSRWFVGRVGLPLLDRYPLPFCPCKGQLGFFEATYSR